MWPGNLRATAFSDAVCGSLLRLRRAGRGESSQPHSAAGEPCAVRRSQRVTPTSSPHSDCAWTRPLRDYAQLATSVHPGKLERFLIWRRAEALASADTRTLKRALYDEIQICSIAETNHQVDAAPFHAAGQRPVGAAFSFGERPL